jgi:hypothetical protein
MVQATRRVPLPDSEIREHLAPALLAAVGGPEGFNAALAAVGHLTLSGVQRARTGGLQAILSGVDAQRMVRLGSDESGRIGGLLVTLHQPPPESWEEVDTRLAGLAARVSFGASEIAPDGTCRLVHGVDAETARPIGSAFKLYVLAALGRAVALGLADWGEQLAIRDDWKSLPSGVLQDRSEGEALSLAEFADPMMGISDNTATDHLIHRLGRDAVERELALLGNRHPDANIPFLTTRAMFQFKCGADPIAAGRYLALPQEGRRAMLEEMERLPLPQLQKAWPEPRHIDDIEWFASATDICRAYAGLLQLDQPQIDHALTRNDEGLTLDETRFPTVWSKPGSEPGVLCLSYLARTATGRTLVTSLSLSDPAPTAGDLARFVDLALSVIRGAFDLLESSEPL